jgi:hypothetical protein
MFTLSFRLKPRDTSGPCISRAKRSSHLAFSQGGTLPEHIMTSAPVQLCTSWLTSTGQRQSTLIFGALMIGHSVRFVPI